MFDPAKHLSWGDLAADNTEAPTVLRVRLKQSKTDQLRQGVEVFVGNYAQWWQCWHIWLREDSSRPILRQQAPDQGQVYHLLREALQSPTQRLSFRIEAATAKGRHRRLYNTDDGSLLQRGLPNVYRDPRDQLGYPGLPLDRWWQRKPSALIGAYAFSWFPERKFVSSKLMSVRCKQQQALTVFIGY